MPRLLLAAAFLTALALGSSLRAWAKPELPALRVIPGVPLREAGVEELALRRAGQRLEAVLLGPNDRELGRVYVERFGGASHGFLQVASPALPGEQPLSASARLDLLRRAMLDPAIGDNR